LAALVMGCGEQAPKLPDVAEVQQAMRREMDAPSDLPDWSESKYVRWASVRTTGERAVIIDIGGGQIDKLLDDSRVSDVLNESYRSFFMHPRARPEFTAHVGWPTLVILDPVGCVRVIGSPKTADEMSALLQKGLEARESNHVEALPMIHASPAPPPGGGDWALDDPSKVGVFVQPDRGAPAVMYEGKPYLYGARANAEQHMERPAARAFLDALSDDEAWLSSEGPLIKCHLPSPEPKPVEGEEEQGEKKK